ncbi:Cu,Zn superoxide dismutase-like protein [Trichocladium antarcticum]|uniref:Superoxide dismutase 1 copper chaperone n=1 Tax=Trichocladium antarcticum TaxID=1450529 RepID=A0AAN6USD4_9PEZI|nr:Cu,Zn superoxide dismutase-like protein [Trichocladium antarcticum]
MPRRISTRSIIGISSFAFITSAGAYSWSQQRERYQQRFQSQSENKIPSNMAVTTPFQTLFAVPMTCEGCAKDITGALHKLPGITSVEASVKDQMVSVEGTAAPSAVVEAIQATGRDAILRGSGTSNSAAVSILETYHHRSDVEITPAGAPGESWVNERLVRGLARMVQVSPTETLVDLTVRGVAPGTYRATIREYGDLKDGASSAGPVWSAQSRDGGGSRGVLGTVEVGAGGYGTVFLNRPFQIWEVIGHALAISRQEETGGVPLGNDEDTIVGVIARSAGVWDNDKTVCSCTGKTLWEERKDEVSKGML